MQLKYCHFGFVSVLAVLGGDHHQSIGRTLLGRSGMLSLLYGAGGWPDLHVNLGFLDVKESTSSDG